MSTLSQRELNRATLARQHLLAPTTMPALDMIEHKGPVGTLPQSARDNAAFLKANSARLQAIDAEADKAEADAGLTPPAQPQQPPQQPQRR